LGAPAPLLPPAMGLPGQEDGNQQALQGPGQMAQLPPPMLPKNLAGASPFGNMDPNMGQMGSQNGLMVPPGNMANGAPPPTNAPPELIAQMAAQIAPQMRQVAGLPPIEGEEKDDTKAPTQARGSRGDSGVQGQGTRTEHGLRT
jgi:hypothetical protein